MCRSGLISRAAFTNSGPRMPGMMMSVIRDVNKGLISATNFQGLQTIGGAEYLVSAGLKILAGYSPQGGLIFHQQNGFRATRRHGRTRGRRRFPDCSIGGKIDIERRAFTGRTVYRDHPIVLPDDSVDRSQPQSGSFAGFLGGKKRFKDVRLHVGGHSRSAIGNGKPHILPRRQFHSAALDLRRVKKHVAGLNHQSAAGGHSIARIYGEVQDDLLDLGTVCGHAIQLLPPY